MDSAATAARILRDGDGLATRRSLLAAGVSPGWLRRRLLRDIWSEPLPGVVDSADVCRTQHGWVRACLEFAGPGSCLSHQTAAVVHGLLPGEGFGQPIHVTVPHGRHKQATAGLVLHQTGQECEVDLVDDIPVTSPAVTIVDLATVMGINDLRCVAADAVRRRLVAVHELHRSKRPARRVRGMLARVVEELEAGAIAGSEAAYWRGVRDAGLPLPVLNHRLATWPEGRAGPVQYRYVDAYWARFRLGAELDGRSVHGTRQAFDADRRRHNLIQLEGNLLMHFSANQTFSDIRGVVAVTGRFLQLRAVELGLPWPHRVL